MRPFKLFFGLSLAILVFFFVARFVIMAFIAAAVLSLLYAVFRRLKDFVTYDRYGTPYFNKYQQTARLQGLPDEDRVEPLFYESERRRSHTSIGDVRFVSIQ